MLEEVELGLDDVIEVGAEFLLEEQLCLLVEDIHFIGQLLLDGLNKQLDLRVLAFLSELVLSVGVRHYESGQLDLDHRLVGIFDLLALCL